MFDTGWSPEKEREPRCKAEKLPTNGPMKTRRGMGSVFCFLFQENFRDVYIIIYMYMMMIYIYIYIHIHVCIHITEMKVYDCIVYMYMQMYMYKNTHTKRICGC